MLKKFFLSFLIFCFVVFIGLVVAILNWLPSPKDLLTGQTSHTGANTNLENSAKSFPSKDEAAQTAVLSESKSENIPEEKDKKQPAEDNENSDSLKAVMNFVEEDFKDIRLCQNLKSPQLNNEMKIDDNRVKDSTDKASIDLARIFSDQERVNPIFEAYRASLKNVFQDPDLKKLFYKIKELGDTPDNPEEKKSFLQKAGFYSQVTYTAAKMMFRKSDFELMNDRARHMALIAEIVSKKPELASDSRVISFCEDLENATKSGETIDIKTERAEVLKLIDYSGLTVQELDFDPSSYTSFSIKSSDQGFSFSMTDKD